MHMHMRKRCTLAAVGALLVVALVPAANAYNIPGTPGSPGGPPTKAKGGSSTSKSVVSKVAVGIAGNTGSELASLGSFKAKVKFPSAGKITCQATSSGTSLGSGSVTSKHAGSATLDVKFTTGGISFLNSHNGQAIPVSLSCTFKPKKGKSSTSTATVTLDA
jgi:hypothetical protein